MTTGYLSQDRELLWSRLGDRISDHLGLHYPPDRLPDLQRGIASAAADCGYEDVPAFVARLLSEPLTPARLATLAARLTIGETYFFREPKTFDLLATRLLPDLIRARRGRDQSLRLWSAGCSSGEEAYSLAILLYELLPDLADWRVTILATDINPQALRKAAGGSYGEWSFRDGRADLKERYFDRADRNRHVIRSDLKNLVTLASLNLVEDGFPSPASGTDAMDLIFCRNVLMYFTPAQSRRVIGRLHRSLREGGLLAVSPNEASQTLFAQFTPLDGGGATVYRKDAAHVSPAVSGTDMDGAATPAWFAPQPADVVPEPQEPADPDGASRLGVACPAAPQPPTETPGTPPPVAARAFANEGRLSDALASCDRWIESERANAAAHYLKAVVLLECGRSDEARGSLRRALYIEPTFVLAHFALGNLAASRELRAEADRHFTNALELLRRMSPDDVVPESEGLTAARLVEVVVEARGHGSRP